MSNTTDFPEGTTLVNAPVVGLESIQRAAFWVLFEGMQNALNEIAAWWAPIDVDFDTRVGSKLAPTTLEAIPPQNFHEGHKPSLLLGTPDDFPNVAVFATRADPSPESDRFDQMESWMDSVLVEIMVKAGGDPDIGYTAEDIVNRRCHRTAEAVVMCLRRNPTLGGAVTNLATAPSISLTDVSAVRSQSQGGGYKGQGGTGERYIWQGASINFRVPKDAILPADGAHTFSYAPDIDYSQHIDQG